MGKIADNDDQAGYDGVDPDTDDFDDAGDTCWMCHGEGGFHDCGEDCCCCLDKEEITDVCEECGGTGYLR